MIEKKDAIGEHKCETCAHWHNPAGLAIGMCIAHPPTLFFLGFAPADPRVKVPLLNPTKPEMFPRSISMVPETAPSFGCHEHSERTRRIATLN